MTTGGMPSPAGYFYRWNTLPEKGEGVLSPGKFMDIRTNPVDYLSPFELLAVTQDSTWVMGCT